ncbi:VOC family protein [Devosia sp. A16]|uniref:VOC family protein n=1 Tax=Devosia sp. A16 TaxID=1736675 RepID=UPI0006D7CDE0|nr:VOC family protein [Devosia sp. A16]
MTNTVHELRLVITVDDFDKAVAFWRDTIGLKEQISVGDDDGHVAILGAGVATLEITDGKHAEFIDRIEVGRPVGGQFRVALRFDDVPEATDRLAAAGAKVLGTPRPTPFRSTNSRLEAPDGLQLTLFDAE